MFFLDKIKKIVDFERELERAPHDPATLREAKRMGFSDSYIAELWNTTEDEVYGWRVRGEHFPGIQDDRHLRKRIRQLCALLLLHLRRGENESVVTDRRKVIILGSGPIRIGQGVEFDYSTVHAVHTIREMGYEAIVINNNPKPFRPTTQRRTSCTLSR